MIIHIDPPIKLYKTFKRVEPVAPSSHQITDYKRCPELYRLKHVLGYTAVGEPVYLTWGRAVHTFFESAEKNIKNFPDVPYAATGLAIQAAMKTWGNQKDADPTDRKWSYMTKARLSDLLATLSGWWVSEKTKKVVEVISTEQPFTIQLPNGMFTSGKPDQIVKWNGKLWARDFKTTSKDIRWFRRELYPNDQFARYTYATSELSGTRVAGVLVTVIYLTKDKGPTIYDETVTYTPESLQRWIEDQEAWKHFIEWSRENDNYPQNESFCKFCQFHEVCKEPTQAAKEYILRSKYVFAPYDSSINTNEVADA